MPREVIDVDKLFAEKAEAEARATAAGQAIEQHQAQVAAWRERREQEFDRGTVSEFKARDEALLAEEKTARDAFKAALLDAPLIEAWVAMRAARWARVALYTEVQSASVRIGQDRNYAMLEPRDGRLLEEMVRIAEDEAKHRGLDRTHSEITEPRETYINAEDQP